MSYGSSEYQPWILLEEDGIKHPQSRVCPILAIVGRPVGVFTSRFWRQYFRYGKRWFFPLATFLLVVL